MNSIFLMIYSLLGFHLNWRAYDFFSEGHPRRWEVTLIVKEVVHVLIDYFPVGEDN